ncbi:MAG: hypothetical protein FWD67_09590 [Betaproteobacteria bacterium]|nr:hypothetical protein [Betaproteobacteria bacterium]
MRHTAFASVKSAKRFLETVQLSLPIAKASLGKTQLKADMPAQPLSTMDIDGYLQLNDKMSQGFVIGNGIVSFNEGVTASLRSAAIHSTLLAQLVANQEYPDRKADGWVINWHRSYYNTLINLGWIIQDDKSGSNSAGSWQGDVSQQVLTLIRGLIGANGAAMVQVMFDSLSKLGDDNAIIKLFEKSSVQDKMAQFSVGLASSNDKDGFLLKAMAFDLEAEMNQTQVLFFKWQSSHCSFSWRNLQLAIAEDFYVLIANDIAAKVAPFMKTFVQGLSLPSAPNA